MKNETPLRPGKLLLSLAIPLLSGGLASLLTRDAMKQYHFFNKPPFSPPGWAFPVVWTLLYLLMGLGCYLVLVSDGNAALRRRALVLYGAQLTAEFLWPLLFFNRGELLAAFGLLLVLWLLVLATILVFRKIRKAAGTLLLPTLLWSSYALYLNYAVYLLSITPMPLPR